VGVAMSVLSIVFAVGLGFGLMAGKQREAGGEGAAAGERAAVPADQEVRYWTCSMHPQIKLPKPGQCPICFMDLVPVEVGVADEAGVPRLALSERAKVLAKVETAEVRLRELTHEIQMVGKVTADETRITHISSYIPGRLDRLFVNYTGIFVRKGDHLAEIYSPELLIAQNEYVLALDALDQAGRQPAEHEMAVSTAKAMREAARRKLELWGIPKDQIEGLAEHRRPGDHMRLDAPLEGWVLDRQGYEGMYVDTGTRLFTLADLRTVWVLLDAYELDIGFIRYGQSAHFQTEAFPGRDFSGRVAYIDPVLNEMTRTVKVRLSVPNPDMKLHPGMFVRAHLAVRLGQGGTVLDNELAGKWISPMHPEIVKDAPGTCDVCGMALVPAESLGFASTATPAAKALAVPQTAVLLTGTRAVVYVEKQEGDRTVYEGRTIELGPRAGDYYIVAAGLAEGERVVTRGALQIDSALQIQAKPSMMQPATQPAAPGETPVTEPTAPPSRAVAGAMYHRHVRPVIEAYLDLVSALAADDEPQAARAAQSLPQAIKAAGPHGLEGQDADLFRSQMSSIASSLSGQESQTLVTLREKLLQLTAALETYLKTFGHDRPGPVVRLYCPMARDNRGAFWFQADSQVRNPYFGAAMLRCGEVKGGIGPDGKETR